MTNIGFKRFKVQVHYSSLFYLSDTFIEIWVCHVCINTLWYNLTVGILSTFEIRSCGLSVDMLNVYLVWNFGFTVAAADFGLENTLRRNIVMKQMCLNDGTDVNNCYNGEIVEGSYLRSVGQ